MNRMFLRRPPTADASDLLAGLTEQQFLNPQQPLKDALAASQQKIGFCPLAAETTVCSSTILERKTLLPNNK